VGRDSAVAIAIRYGLVGPGIESRFGARFSASVQAGPEAHPASYTMGTRSFPGVKRPGRGVSHPPSYSAEVKERVELYVHSPSGPSWPVLRWTLPLLYFSYSYSPTVIANLLYRSVHLSCFRVYLYLFNFSSPASQLLEMYRTTQVFFLRHSVKKE
jgi:hypothetical protein